MVENHNHNESGSNGTDSEQVESGCEVCSQVENARNLEKFELRNGLKRRFRIAGPIDVVALLVSFVLGLIGLIAALITIDEYIQTRYVAAKPQASQTMSKKGGK